MTGKVLLSDFLSEYCELLGFDFSLPEYKKRKVKKTLMYLKKFGTTDIVPLCDATNGRFPFVVCNSLYREYADIYGNDPEKLENILEKYDI